MQLDIKNNTLLSRTALICMQGWLGSAYVFLLSTVTAERRTRGEGPGRWRCGGKWSYTRDANSCCCCPGRRTSRVCACFCICWPLSQTVFCLCNMQIIDLITVDQRLLHMFWHATLQEQEKLMLPTKHFYQSLTRTRAETTKYGSNLNSQEKRDQLASIIKLLFLKITYINHIHSPLIHHIFLSRTGHQCRCVSRRGLPHRLRTLS